MIELSPVWVGTKNSYSKKAIEETNEIKEREEGRKESGQARKQSDTIHSRFHLELLAMPNFMKWYHINYMVIISKNSLIQSIINTNHLMNIHMNEFEFFP